MGLLEHVTATSLDADYAAAAQRRAEQDPGGRPGRPGRVALVVLAAFGVLVATAGVQTARTADESASSRSSLIKQANDRKAQLADRRASLRALQRQVSTLRSRNLAATSQGRQVQRQLTALGVASGSSATRGPGIQVTVDDAPGAKDFKQQVQAPDLQKLVNGLWQVGAEAVSINGQRLTSLSAIRDAAGSVTVNFRSLRAPYTISAVGNPKTMGAALLDTAGGQTWVTLQSTFGLQFAVDTKDSMLLPAAKRVTLRVARQDRSATGSQTGTDTGPDTGTDQ
jgi:uncharacterized protein YlxW (UPF0749 family)